MIQPVEWREIIEREAAAGARFGCLYAAEDGTGRRVVAVLQSEDGFSAHTCSGGEGSVPSLIDIFPAAEWDEREAHDLYGVNFDGHDPLKPLVHHLSEPRRWMTPVKGREVHQVAVGPIHAGVIESGHFRFHLVGEKMLALDLRLFYKHRGIERMLEGRDPAESLRLAGRICGSSNIAIQVAVAQSWESWLGLEAGEDLRRARTLLIELERLYNHLNDIGAICAGVGYSPGAMAFAALKERAQRILAELTGHRFGFNSVDVGRSSLAVAADRLKRLSRELADIAVEAAGYWREILFSASIQDRLRTTGVVDLEQAERLALLGPAARASGLKVDRRSRPDTGLAYGPGFEVAELEEPRGDVASRTEIRAVEIEQCRDILGALLEEPIRPDSAGRSESGEEPAPDRSGTALGRPVVVSVEGPRGEILAALEVEDGKVGRLHLRTASFRNWPALKVAVVGDILPDFPLINKSFELSYAAVDR